MEMRELNIKKEFNMRVDIKGRIEKMKLKKDKCLLPLFESIVNSFQAIEELDNINDTYIKITIKRDLSQQSYEDTNVISPIIGFIIEDNGIGFNKDNFESFDTSDSTYKFEKGGKGIGRFLWLKSFEQIRVESIFEESDTRKKITFDFELDNDPIKNIKRIDTDEERKTKIYLDNFKLPFIEKTRKTLDAIGIEIIEHCLSYFFSDDCPNVLLEDNKGSINLNNLLKNNMCISTEKEEFQINGEKFYINHVKLYDLVGKKNRVHFCANNREVKSQNLSKMIPDLNGAFIKDENLNNSFIYSAYISGRLLDNNVNDERTDFNLKNNNLLNDNITISDLEDKSIELIKEYLKDFIEPIKKRKIQRIQEYICKEKPQYKTILKYKKSALDNIPANISDDKLEIELFKIRQSLNLEIKIQGEDLLKRNKAKDIINTEEYKKRYTDYIEKENDLGKSALAEYISHRKVVIDLLEDALNMSTEGKYSLEEYIHKLIFPMRSVSEEVSYEDHNLWLIDEKLAYHFYLASDKAMKNIDVVNVDSLKRPDLLIMDKPILITDDNNKPYNSLTIIEFKRAMRDGYKDDNNPIQQVYNYVRDIRKGSEKDRRGRPLAVNSNTAFYLYIIADLTEDLRDYAENYNLHETVDGMGYFGYNDQKNINAYIEVISYDKLLEDAKKKNKVLFEKLFTPNI